MAGERRRENVWSVCSSKEAFREVHWSERSRADKEDSEEIPLLNQYRQRDGRKENMSIIIPEGAEFVWVARNKKREVVGVNKSLWKLRNEFGTESVMYSKEMV